MEEKEMPEQEEQVSPENLQETPVEPTQQTQEEDGISELDALKSALEEQKEKYIRLYAEFDNFKRRNAKERVELIQTAGRDVIQSMLEVVDDCDRA